MEAATPPLSSDQPNPSRGRLRTLVRKISAWVVVVVVGVLILAQTPFGATAIARPLLIAFAPPGLSIGVGSLGWFSMASIELNDLSVEDASRQNVFQAETLTIDHSFLFLLVGKLRISEIHIEGGRLTFQDRPDGVWGLGLPTEQEPEAAATPRDFAIRRIEVRDSRLEVLAEGSGAEPLREDSIAVLTSLNGRVDDFVVRAEGGLDGELAPTEAVMFLGVTVPEYSMQLHTEGALDGRLVLLDTLGAHGRQSEIGGRINIDWSPVSGGEAVTVQGRFASPSLEPVDILAFVPVWKGETAAVIESSIEGPVDSLTLQLTASAAEPAEGGATGTVTVQMADAARRLAWQVEFADLDPRVLVGPAGIEGALNGQTEARMVGDRPDQWSGDFTLSLRPSRVAEVDVRPSSLRLDFAEGLGTGTLDLEAVDRLGTTRFAGPLSIRLFDSLPEYSVAGSLEREIPREGQEPVALFALAELAGSGFAPAEIDVEGSVRADATRPTMIGRVRVSDARGTFDLDRGRGEWQLAVSAGDAALNGRGAIDVDSTRARVTAERVAWSNLDIAALLGDTIYSRLTGHGSASFAARSDGTTATSGQAFLSALGYGTAAIDSARGTWTTRDDARGAGMVLGAGMTAWVDEGIAQAQITGTPLGPEPRYRITEGSVAGLDVGALLATSDSTHVSTDLNTTFTGEWRGSDPAQSTAALEWVLLPSRVQGTDSLSGSGGLALEGGVVAVRGAVEAPGQSASVSASLGPLADTPSWEILGFDFEGVRPDMWLGTPPPTGSDVSLRGSIQGKGAGLAPTTANGQLGVILDGSSVGQTTFDRARLVSTFEAGTYELEVEAASDSFRVTGLGEVSVVGPQPTYRVDLAGGLGTRTGTVSEPLRASLVGRGFSPDSLEADLRLTLDTVTAAGVTLENGAVRLTAANGRVSIDTFRVVGPNLEITAEGFLGLAVGSASNFSLDATATSLDILRPVVDARPLSIGEGHVSLSLVGPYRSAELSGSVSANAILFDELQLLGLEMAGTGVLDGARAESALLTASASGLTTPSASVRQSDLEFDYDGERIAVALTSDVDPRRTLEINARIDPRPEARLVEMERLSASLDRDVWSLIAPTTIRYGDSIVVDSLDMRAGEQRLFATGRLGASGEQDFRMLADGFRIGTISDLIGWDDLEGTLSGSVELGGTAASPTLAMEYRSQLSSPTAPNVTLNGTLNYAADVFEVDGTVAHDPDGTLHAVGVLPMTVRLPWRADSTLTLVEGAPGPVDFRVTADSLGLAWLRPFFDPRGLRDLNGALDGDIRVVGTAAEPRLVGGGQFTRGSVVLADLGTTWTEMRATVGVDASRIVLEDVHVRSGDGSLQGSGTVALNQLTVGEFDVDLTATDFSAINNRLARATLSGEGQLTGTTARPEVRGSVDLLSTDVFLGSMEFAGDVRDVALTETDYADLEAAFGRDFRTPTTDRLALVDSLDLDVIVSMGRDTWVRQSANPQLAIQMSGDLRITKPRADSLSLVGEIEAIPQRSYIEQFGRRFSLAPSTITFRGSPAQTLVDIQGTYSVPSAGSPDQAEVTIRLGVEGTPERMNVLLSSDPSMDNSDIVSYLATGRPASQDVDLGTSQTNGTGTLGTFGTGLAVGAVANAIEGAAADRIGLDVVNIETDGLRGARLVAGRYVSPSLFVGFKQPLTLGSGPARTSGTNTGSEVEIEYQALRWLLLNLEAGGRGFDFLLRSRFAY